MPALWLSPHCLFPMMRCVVKKQCTRMHHFDPKSHILFWKKAQPLSRSLLTVLFCSLADLDPRVGHTIDVLSPFISVLCRSEWLFHGETCPRIDLVNVHSGHARSSSPACTWHCPLHYLFLQATPTFPHGVTHSMLASLLWQCLTVPFYSNFVKNPLICFLCCPRNPQNLF